MKGGPNKPDIFQVLVIINRNRKDYPGYSVEEYAKMVGLSVEYYKEITEIMRMQTIADYETVYNGC